MVNDSAPPRNPGGFASHAPLAVDLAILGVICSAYAFFSFRADFISDDAFISFRYARNLVDGHGLTFNPGERVEGYSNLLYVLLVAALHFLGMDPVTAGRLLGLASGALLIVVAYRVALVVTAGSSRLYAGLAAAALGCNAYLAAWGRGGLETTLYSLLVMATLAPLVTQGVTRASFLRASLVASALTLTRMEGVAVYALVSSWALAVPGEPWRRRVKSLLPGFAVFVTTVLLLTLWRFAYYGDLLPNTFAAKSGFTLLHARRGIQYIGGLARTWFFVPAVLLCLFSAGASRRRPVALLALVLAGLLAIVVWEGGDGLPAYRFAVPLLAPLFVLAGVGASVLGGRSRLAALAALAGLAALVPASRAMARDAQYRRYEDQRRIEVPTWSMTGRWLRGAMPPGTVLATVPIGAVSYYSGLPLIDMMGLTDRHIARRKVEGLGSGWAGHEKSDGAYVLSRRPDILLLGNIFVSSAPLDPPAPFPPYENPSIYAREREVVEDPLFLAYRYVAFPMGKNRYLHAYVRTDSPAIRAASRHE